MTNLDWQQQNYKKLLKTPGRILPLVQRQAIYAANAKSAKRDTQHLHPSEISKKNWCIRSSWYQIQGYESIQENYALSRLNIFAEGNSIHSKWQNWLKDAGVLHGFWKCLECSHIWYDKSPAACTICGTHLITYREVPIRDDEHRIIGHADGEIEDDKGRALIEIKSIGLGTVRWEMPTLYRDYESKELTLDQLWAQIKRPFPSHLRQGNIYMHCRKIDTVIYIYEWKPSQQVKEFELRYNPEIVAPILEGCKKVMQHLEDNTVPMRPQWATEKSCSGCKYCPYRNVCWK